MLKKFKVYNHNNILLGVFDTAKEAYAEARTYHYQTGNAAYVEEA